ncbi:MAG TPA: FtsW/RodA/SpoVE family cell cycle protein, partial [Actinomycetota bacterium]|nr:FtsW/RodA/SpoVE family cell cycle protein [Actinomycetota bacterium]
MSREALPLARARGGTALALTILALILSVGAYALAGMGRRGHIPVNLALYGSIFAIGYVAAYLVIRRFAPLADPALFPAAAVLVGVGFAMIFRLSGGLAAEQATWIALGIAIFCAAL